jgi:heptosyltransferase III
MNEPNTSSYGRGDSHVLPGCARILVIRPGAIGDVLLTFPALKALREHYTNAHIMLVSNAQVLPLALASGVAEEASDYQDTRWSELFSTTGIHTATLASPLDRTDLAICWIHDADSIVERNLRAAGAKRLIIAPGRPPEDTDIHIVDYLAQTIGLPPVGPRLWMLNIQSGYVHHRGSLADKSAMGAINRGSQRADKSAMGTINRPLRYVAIHPGSGGAQKCWPASHFAVVIERLWQQNRSVLLLEGPADTEQVCNLLNLVPSPPVPEMLKMLTNAPLLEVARQLQQCRCYLGNDSGITHLAAMLGIPTVAIFGPSNPAVWRPLGPSVKVIQEQALADVCVDAVMEAIEQYERCQSAG